MASAAFSLSRRRSSYFCRSVRSYFLRRLRTVEHLPELEESHTALASTWDRSGGNADGTDYKRIEGAFVAPRLFNRRGSLTTIGGWREATEVGFYGIGNANTSSDDRANYSFDQPYGSATLDLWPARKILLLRGGVELSEWNQGSGQGAAPSVDEVYTSETLPGLGANPTYLHTQATIALDTRPSPGYARRGGYLGVTFHDFRDQDGRFG